MDRRAWYLAIVTAALPAGGVAWLVGGGSAADACWAAGTLLALIPALGNVIRTLRQRGMGVDLVAVLALVGTLAVGQYLAGALIAVMLATGDVLESAARRRARRDLRALADRAPAFARRRCGAGLERVPVGEVAPGDVLVVGPGEMVPVDGGVAAGPATLDESALTGESRHVTAAVGDAVRSGALNAGGAFELRATARAEESTYAGIVRLTREAGAETTRLVRLADRYAAWFLPLTLAVAAAAGIAAGSATRAVAVLVVATPCPLLLAAPVAIVAGLSRAARAGIVVRDGGALERLGAARTLLMDKTGTLTAGRPVVTGVAAAPGRDAAEVLRQAAAVEQVSPHVLAAAIVAEAHRRGVPLPVPSDAAEVPGRGVSGTVDGRRVTVGRMVGRTEPGDAAWARGARDRDGAIVAWVAVDGAAVGAVLLRDTPRRDAPRTVRRLRAAGLRRIVMLTGDRRDAADEVSTLLGLDAALAELAPADKLAAVRDERSRAVTVMVGDGINDAPALAAADVGVAMGVRGATAASEAADVVLTTDRIDRLADAIDIAHRSRRIAVQSAVLGMGLSLAAMAAAGFGWIAPDAGALLQEGIDVAAILNALRATVPGRARRRDRVALPAATAELLRRFAAEHDELRDTLGELRDVAAAVATGPPSRARDPLDRVRRLLTTRLLPHEDAEEHLLYPALATPLGSTEATATMSRAHSEIALLARRIVARSETDLTPDQLAALSGDLYGLHALLILHFAQEEENYFVLTE